MHSVEKRVACKQRFKKMEMEENINEEEDAFFNRERKYDILLLD